MSFTVKLLTTKNIYGALDWCLENLNPAYWSMNDIEGSILKRNGYNSDHKFVFITAIINKTNPLMHKAHYVNFVFEKEEDAVHFKLVWQ
jgi:hypothetical protein